MKSQSTATEPQNTESEPGAADQNKNALPPSSQDTALYRSTGRISAARKKPTYKNIPEDWRAIPPGRFKKVIGHLESVLLEISVDGTVTSNLFDWKPTIPTLETWADHLRSALKELTK